MGKAAKKNQNRIAKQIASNKENEDFIKMIESMEDSKSYQLRKGKTLLFNGLSAPGTFWKSQFLKPKTNIEAVSNS